VEILVSSLLATAPSLDVPSIAMGLLGGLGLFLYGMHKMSDGLKAAAGDSMKTLLARLTTNRFMAALTGALVTAVLQSSSITTVLVVGFVSAGLMTLAQTVGVIMGANVGTTVTAQILAFNITDYAWAMIAAGFVAWSFSRRDVMRNLGAMLLGFGMLFIGMDQMGAATHPLRSHQPFVELMQQMDNPLPAILVGATFTALVQSSSATIGIVIVLATQGYISLEAGIALGIGAKIGTCVTAVLAGLGRPVEARRVGVVHVLFNALGAVLWLPFIDQLATLAAAVSPTYPHLEGIQRLGAETPRQVANAITIFAAINLGVMIWFTGPIARLTQWLIPGRPLPEPERVGAKYLDPVFVQTPAVALDQVRLELGHLGECVARMLAAVPRAVVEGTSEDLGRLVAMDDDVDRLHADVLHYLGLLAREELQTAESGRLEAEVKVANDLEAIGDLIETSLVAQGRRRLQLKLRLANLRNSGFGLLHEAVARALDDVLRALAENDQLLAREVIQRKDHIHELANAATERLAADMLVGHGSPIPQFRIESDMIDQVQRIFYHVRRIAATIAP
jgi:phosphate:Na+ symporter